MERCLGLYKRALEATNLPEHRTDSVAVRHNNCKFCSVLLHAESHPILRHYRNFPNILGYRLWRDILHNPLRAVLADAGGSTQVTHAMNY